MGKMTDGDVMVYIRNQMLELEKIAKEYKVTICILSCSDGFSNCRVNDYAITHWENKDIYLYEPRGARESWEYDIRPQSINFAGRPYMKRGGRK